MTGMDDLTIESARKLTGEYGVTWLVLRVRRDPLIRAAARAGMSQSEISRSMGVARQTVIRVLRRAGIEAGQ
jgi:predicted transcriptional regulator